MSYRDGSVSGWGGHATVRAVDRLWRLIVGLAGAAGVYFATWGAVIVLFGAALAAQKPDRTVPNGDPCCPTPDTWAETGLWMAGALMGAALDLGLFTVSVAVVWWALRERWPTRRGLAAASMLAALVAAPVWYGSVVLL